MRLESKIGMLACLALLPFVGSCGLRIDHPVCDLTDPGDKVNCAIRLPGDWRDRVKDSDKAKALLSMLQALPAGQPTDLQARLCTAIDPHTDPDKAQQRAYVVGSPRRTPNPVGKGETFVIAGIIDEKFNCFDQRYKAGGRGSTTAYYVVFTGNGMPIDEKKDVPIGTWETYAFTLTSSGISVSKNGLNSGTVIHCGNHHPSLQRQIGFRTCAAVRAAEEASKNLGISVREVYARIFTLAPTARIQALEAARVKIDDTMRVAIMTADEEKDPMWLDCPLGCCTLDEIITQKVGRLP